MQGEDSIQMIVAKLLIGVAVVLVKVVCACARLVVSYGKLEIVLGDEEHGALVMWVIMEPGGMLVCLVQWVLIGGGSAVGRAV